MKATRIFADAAGVAHFADFDLAVSDAGQIGRPSSVQPGEGVIFCETDDSYDYDWHPAPRKQWLILQDERILIETEEGEIHEFGGREILLLDNAGTKGHGSKQLNQGIRRSIFIPIP